MTRNEGNGDGRWLALGSKWRDGEKHGGGGRGCQEQKIKKWGVEGTTSADDKGAMNDIRGQWEGY